MSAILLLNCQGFEFRLDILHGFTSALSHLFNPSSGKHLCFAAFPAQLCTPVLWVTRGTSEKDREDGVNK